MAPVALEAARRPGVSHLLVATGQHDRLFDQALSAFGITADLYLGLGTAGQTIDALQHRIEHAIEGLVSRVRPDLLLVQGDTTTAWATALAAHRLGVAVGHVEAGLRSHNPDLPWPEERNRVAIDRVADLLFAPTTAARANLAAEPGVRGAVHVIGNSGIDALLHVHKRLGAWRPDDPTKRRILVTCHRRENIGAPIASICRALRTLSRRSDVEIMIPVHPNPRVQAGINEGLAGVANVALVPPLDYAAMVRIMAGSHLILSDSGGLQEEAPALGIPLLVLRDNTERPEAVATGTIKLVGTAADAIVAEASRLLDDPAAHAAMARPSFPYGRGDAAVRILDAIEAYAGRAIVA